MHHAIASVPYLGLGNLHAEAHTTTLLLTSALLHLLADLDVDIEELGDTAVQADGLALVQVTLAVVGGDTLLGAGLGEAAGEEEDRLESVGCGGSRQGSSAIEEVACEQSEECLTE